MEPAHNNESNNPNLDMQEQEGNRSNNPENIDQPRTEQADSEKSLLEQRLVESGLNMDIFTDSRIRSLFRAYDIPQEAANPTILRRIIGSQMSKLSDIQASDNPIDRRQYREIMAVLGTWSGNLEDDTRRQRERRSDDQNEETTSNQEDERGTDAFFQLMRERDEITERIELGLYDVDNLHESEMRRQEDLQRLMLIDTQLNVTIRQAQHEGILHDINHRLDEFEKNLSKLQELQRQGNLQRGAIDSFSREIDRMITKSIEATTRERGKFKGVREFVSTKKLEELKDKAADTIFKELPTSTEAQRDIVRTVLNRIEATTAVSWSHVNAQDTKILTNFLIKPELDEQLGKEIQARLRLHDCFVLVNSSLQGGGTNRELPTKVTGSLFQQAQRQLSENGRLLEGQDFNTLLKNGIADIPIQQAFYELQREAHAGNILGPKISDTKRQENINVIVQRLQNTTGVSKEVANKAVEFAWRIATATLEKSVWNVNLDGVDPLAGAIYLRTLREGKSYEKDRGPKITLTLIEGIGSSFFRMVTDVDKKKLDPDANRGLTTEDFTIVENGDPKKYKRIVNDPSNSIDIPDMDFEKLASGAYGYFLNVNIPRFLQAREMLTKMEWKPDELDYDDVEGNFSEIFDSLDPKRETNLRRYFVAGALYGSLRDEFKGKDLGWDTARALNVRSAMLAVLKTQEEDTPNGLKKFWKSIMGNGEIPKGASFLTKDDWDEINKMIKLRSKLRKIDFLKGSEERF